MERWELFDRNGNSLSRTIRRGERMRSGEYHKVVHIWVVNSMDRVLIQQRSARRKLMPNVWAVTGGSVIAGEESLAAACREFGEELGVWLPPEEFHYIGRMVRRNSLCDAYVVCRNIAVPDMHLQREEVARVRWVTVEQLADMLRRRQYHHYGASYFRFIFDGIAAVCGRDLAKGEDFNCLPKR
ncbi:MAG: NUDIX domain-containing protein [Clostridia bacterium]|nr:NUDIX domain-containing protein [Clostridia bacterium]